MVRAEDLEAAIDASIAADEDDPTPFLVYADWLQSRGDPLGELIVFHHRGARDVAAAVLEVHRERFLGPFARTPPATFKLEWQLGFVHAAELGWDRQGADPAAQLHVFLELPACRFLKHLRLGPLPRRAGTTRDFRPLLDVLVETRRPPALRTLFAGDHGTGLLADTQTGPIDDVLATFPRLRHVKLQGGRVRVGAIDHAELRGFAVHTARLDRLTLDDICSAVWPRLDQLAITLGEGNCELRDLAPLLAGASLPALRHLGLVECTFTDELVPALAASALLPRLATLDLSDGQLTDDGARAIAAARRSFAHLGLLRAERNQLTRAGRAVLRGAVRHVDLGSKPE